MRANTTKIKEAPYSQDLFDKWIKKNEKTILSCDSWANVYDVFINWVEQNNYESISKTAFIKKLKPHMLKNNINLLPSDSEIEKREGKERVRQDVNLKGFNPFKALEKYIYMMHRGIINSLIVYGRPGLGKSKVTIDELKRLKTNFVVYSGGLKGAYELAKILYENRKDTVLVFDDFDSAFKTKNQINLLKTALQDEQTRYISYVDTTKKARKDKIPERFEFTSGVIFITNKLRIDASIRSRSKTVNIDISTLQTLERIKEVLPEFMPKVPIEFKEEVYAFVKSNISKIRVLDFRLFKWAVANYLIDKDENVKDGRWKKWTLNELNA
jgi:hypothetical protein